MRKVTLTLVAAVFAFGLNGFSQAKILMPAQVNQGVTVVELAQQQAVNWVSIAVNWSFLQTILVT